MCKERERAPLPPPLFLRRPPPGRLFRGRGHGVFSVGSGTFSKNSFFFFHLFSFSFLTLFLSTLSALFQSLPRSRAITTIPVPAHPLRSRSHRDGAGRSAQSPVQPVLGPSHKLAPGARGGARGPCCALRPRRGGVDPRWHLLRATQPLAQLLAEVDAVPRQQRVGSSRPAQGHFGDQGAHGRGRHRRRAQLDRLSVLVHRVAPGRAGVDSGARLDEAVGVLSAVDLDSFDFCLLLSFFFFSFSSFFLTWSRSKV